MYEILNKNYNNTCFLFLMRVYHDLFIIHLKGYICSLFHNLQDSIYTLVPGHKPGKFIILDLLIIKHELHVIPAGNLFLTNPPDVPR